MTQYQPTYYFTNKAMIERNARRFAMAREDEKRVDQMAKSHKRPTLLDRVKNAVRRA